MMSLCGCVLLLLVPALSLAIEEEFQPAYLSPASMHPPPSTRLSLLQYLLAAKNRGDGLLKNAVVVADDEDDELHSHPPMNKRFSDFMPYIKSKKNNGIWIWMPAQGYVSVPKDQQALENAEAAKQGKIMRYGK
jgi:hypothetical protein